jgi:hypothetical protein
MEHQLLNRIDDVIERYKREHKGEAPLYIVLSSDEHKQLLGTLRKKSATPEGELITSYKGIKLAHHPGRLSGDIYVSNELPETGS